MANANGVRNTILLFFFIILKKSKIFKYSDFPAIPSPLLFGGFKVDIFFSLLRYFTHNKNNVNIF